MGWSTFWSRLSLLTLLAQAACQTTQAVVPTSFELRRSAAYQKGLAARIDSLIAAQDPNLHVGISIASTLDGANILERNSAQRFVPASTSKLFTGAAALSILGPAHRFHTDIAIDEPDKTGHTTRNIYLRGVGDPSLTVGHLGDLAGSVKQQGITTISGDIVVDDSAFDAVPWGRGWMWDDLQDGYSAPVSAVNVSGNNVVVQILPGARTGAAVRVTTTPTTGFVTVSNQATTTAAGTSPSLRILVNNVPPDPLGLQVGQGITLTGSLPLDAHTKFRRFAIRDTAAWAGTLLKEQLRNQRIEVSGFVRRGLLPAAAVPIAQHASPQLSAILTDAMKASDNHAMECLLKRIGQLTAMAPGNWSNGTQAVRKFLQQSAGLDMTGLNLEDGSGNSRYSLMNPTQMTRLLLHVHDSFDIGPELIAALPIGGTDGTLAHRMGIVSLRNQVRAKTGTMTGVSNLAGFLHTEEGDILAFSLLMDAYAGQASTLRRLQDGILLQLFPAPQP
jgi:D-alanyl-D-alanine carboxypeptidase/D-alanyl-D-alanine-endopeptidase (penicillin-binding protein 4)